MDVRPIPSKAYKLTGNICPTCHLPIGLVTLSDASGTTVLFCPVCQDGWSKAQHPPTHKSER